MFGITKRPWPSETAVNVTPVAFSLASTVAPGRMLPVASDTMPLSVVVALPPCAYAGTPPACTRASTNMTQVYLQRALIIPVLLDSAPRHLQGRERQSHLSGRRSHPIADRSHPQAARPSA